MRDAQPTLSPDTSVAITRAQARLGALLTAARERLHRGVTLLSATWSLPRHRRHASLLTLLLVSVFFCLLGWNDHRAHPSTADELCSLNQARAFSSLSATLPLTTFNKHEDPTNTCFTRSERGFFSVQAPGWSALLAALTTCGIPRENAPWLIASTTLFLTGVAGFLIAGLPVALMSMVFLANNQFFDEMSRTLWSHPACLLFVTMGVVSTLIAISPETKRQRLTLSIVGVSLGLAMLTRPLVGVSCLVGVVGSLTLVSENRKLLTRRHMVALGAGPSVAFILYGLFNLATTEDFFLNGYEFMYGPWHNPGFYQLAPDGAVHTPERAWMLLRHHVRHLVQFSLPYLWLLWVVVATSVTIGWNRKVASLIITLCAMWLGAATYWCSSYLVGPRFYYESTVPLILLITTSVWSLTHRGVSYISSPRLANAVHVSVFVVISVLLLPSPPVQ